MQHMTKKQKTIVSMINFSIAIGFYFFIPWTVCVQFKETGWMAFIFIVLGTLSWLFLYTRDVMKFTIDRYEYLLQQKEESALSAEINKDLTTASKEDLK